MQRLGKLFRTMRRYPTIAISLFIILSLVCISVYTMISMPLSEALDLWNEPHDEWRDTPVNAQPVWTNWFRRADLPETIIVPIEDFAPEIEAIRDSVWQETTLITFDYPYVVCPSADVEISIDVEFYRKIPMLTLTWVKPDGSEIEIRKGVVRGGDSRLKLDPYDAFAAPDQTEGVLDALSGQYTLRAEAMTFEEGEFSLDGQIVVYGRVYGIAGTDNQRRDLRIGLLWGMPIALLTGIIASFGTTVFGFILAATGAWHGGWIDAAIQRTTEVCMMIPFLPCILIVMKYCSASIWTLLVFVIGFRVFSGPLKSHRAMFLQLLNSQYIEAARAYGASNTRIIFRYLLPRIFPVLLPRLILGIPLFVFLEASIALLGRADALLPTWGKLLAESREALYMGHYYWVLEPAFLLMLTGFAFALLGYTLDRVFNPRLRDV